MIISSHEKLQKVVPISQTHKMTFFFIQDQEIMIKSYESQSEDYWLLDKMILYNETG